MQNENALIARICHDLITPFNAINLGFEAFEVSRDNSLLSDIRESVDKVNCIIKFVRELYSERSRTFCYNAHALQLMISELLKFYNINFKLESDMESIANIAGKIVMYMAVISKEIMPFGGMVILKIDNEKSEIITRCIGKNISIPSINSEEELNHKNVFRYNFSRLLTESGFELEIKSEGEEVVFYKRIK